MKARFPETMPSPSLPNKARVRGALVNVIFATSPLWGATAGWLLSGDTQTRVEREVAEDVADLTVCREALLESELAGAHIMRSEVPDSVVAACGQPGPPPHDMRFVGMQVSDVELTLPTEEQLEQLMAELRDGIDERTLMSRAATAIFGAVIASGFSAYAWFTKEM